MKHRGLISGKVIVAEHPFIVYSHTKGLLGGSEEFEEAQRAWQLELASCAERGKESDALLFHSNHGEWVMWGDLYDLPQAEATSAEWTTHSV